MANIISAEKRARQTVRRTAHNRFHVVRMRTAIKKTREEKDATKQRDLFKTAQSYIARTAKRGVITKKAAQRLTMRLALYIKPKNV